MDGVDGALCPTLSVLPARVDFAKPGGVLQNIQSDISSSVQFESISLGKVQSWINPGDTQHLSIITRRYLDITPLYLVL